MKKPVAYLIIIVSLIIIGVVVQLLEKPTKDTRKKDNLAALTTQRRNIAFELIRRQKESLKYPKTFVSGSKLMYNYTPNDKLTIVELESQLEENTRILKESFEFTSTMLDIAISDAEGMYNKVKEYHDTRKSGSVQHFESPPRPNLYLPYTSESELRSLVKDLGTNESVIYKSAKSWIKHPNNREIFTSFCNHIDKRRNVMGTSKIFACLRLAIKDTGADGTRFMQVIEELYGF